MTLRQAPPGHSHVLATRDTHNAFVHTTEVVEGMQGGRSGPAGRGGRQPGIVTVRNDSGADVDRYGVLGIGGILITPTDNEAEFLNRVLLSGVTPGGASHKGKLVILLEPLAAGSMGRALIDGAGQVLVEMIDEVHEYADVADNDAAKLESGPAGFAQLLWVQAVGDRTDPAVAWCVVRLGVGQSMPTAYKAVTGESGGEIDVKPVNADGTTTGTTETWKVFP